MLRRCVGCGRWVESDYGKDSPGTHAGDGSEARPLEPGDWDSICAPCGYDHPNKAELNARARECQGRAT